MEDVRRMVHVFICILGILEYAAAWTSDREKSCQQLHVLVDRSNATKVGENANSTCGRRDALLLSKTGTIVDVRLRSW